MSRPMLAYTMMGLGAVAALSLAAGPLASSHVVQALFGASLLLLAGGAGVRRIHGRQAALSGSADGEIRQALEALGALRRGLIEATDDMAATERLPLHQGSDEKLRAPVREFLQHRQVLLDGFGFASFAELMIRFARVERSINRAHSASADGATEEARSCLQRASLQMEDCLDACVGLGRPDEKGSL